MKLGLLPIITWITSFSTSIPPGVLPTAQDSTFVLSGIVEGMDTGTIYLFHDPMQTFEPIKVHNGYFSVTGKLSEPDVCALVIKTADDQITAGSPDFIVSPGQTTIKIPKGNFDSTKVVGSQLQQELEAFNKKISAQDQEDSAYSANALQALHASDLVFNKKREISFAYASDNPNSFVALYGVYKYCIWNPDLTNLKKTYTRMSSSLQATRYGSIIRRAIDGGERISRTGLAPDFTQNDTAGRPIKLSSFRGQYVLIDFWASWCGPCRMDNPGLVELYKKYHSRGFTILGVSFDYSKQSWLAAIQKDKLEWSQVSELNLRENTVGKLYGVYQIPSNFLLDRNGKVIAKSLRPIELEQLLSTIFRKTEETSSKTPQSPPSSHPGE